MLRGTSQGLEFVFSDDGAAALALFQRRLGERPEFYRGSVATASFAELVPSNELLRDLVSLTNQFGIELRGVYGAVDVATVAEANGLAYLGLRQRESPRAVTDLGRRRASRSSAVLTDAARSLEADFAGARADLAARRVRRPLRVAAANLTAVAARPASSIVDAVATRYYRGTVRGGQSLQQVGNIVVVGDVNPGAELVASGDIVVFGTLRGTAHAGAQGDRAARVAALKLSPTQLRIATCIAAGDGDRRGEPEEARIEGERIVIVPLSGARP
ncbi:MAG: septum site-determining protein MinC [Candidatus Eremiobacteraeota bacterium]|nr:septum site-determining protein MinC [Candidatus Eremiobacteraeota bacterium]